MNGTSLFLPVKHYEHFFKFQNYFLFTQYLFILPQRENKMKNWKKSNNMKHETITSCLNQNSTPKSVWTRGALQRKRRVIVGVLWDRRGILLMDYLKNDKTIIGEYYTHLLTSWKEKFVRPNLDCEKNITFHEDHQCSRQQVYCSNG